MLTQNKERREEQKGDLQNKQQNSKRLNTIISIIILNVNGLNIPA